MRHFLFITILIFFFGIRLFSQTNEFYNVNQLFEKHPEVVIKFTIQNRDEIATLTKLISIDNVKGNEVTAYANRKEFEYFLTLNIPFEFVERIVLTPEELNMKEFEAIENSKNNWDYYPSYDAYLSLMAEFAANYPELCYIAEFGTSVQNRKLLACVISNNVHTREAEPQVFLSSSMHGDELTGYVLMLRYIDYLLSNYGTDPRITYLLDNMEIWVSPLANPDGTFKTGNSSVSGSIRYNANNIDLNRNYKDWKYGDHPDGKAWQKETLAFMALQESESFVLGFNLHGGTEVCNYPWDNNYALTADDAWWQLVCREYVDTVHKVNPNYFKDYNNGIVRGCNWYVISGGRQDYTNYYDHTREVTVEISTTKTPTASTLPNYWNWNYRSFLNFTQQALYGIHGIVTDVCSGEPVYAKIFINGLDINNSFVMTDPRVGYYARLVKGGTYSVTYSADGYISKNLTVTISDYQQVIQNIALMPEEPVFQPIANFSADHTLIDSQESVIVQFSDISTICPDSWLWYFEGGIPETSTEQNPVISYEGIFAKSLALDVKLVVSNAAGKDSILKEDYIVIVKKLMADFEADKTEITEGELVHFFDLSKNATSWDWYFEGGVPQTSIEQNPIVVYNNKGIFDVKLTVTNNDENFEISKENYITVKEIFGIPFVSPQSIEIETDEVQGEFSVSMKNIGNAPFNYNADIEVSENENWLIFSNISGSLEAEEQVKFILNYDFTSLISDIYVANLTIDVTDSIISVPVTINYSISGISKNENNNFIIYPNPATNDFTILFTKVSSSTVIEIYNVAGQNIYTENIYEKSKTFIIKDLGIKNKGVYFIKIQADEYFKTKKLILK